VVMPTIETKSRASIINELKKTETKEDSQRLFFYFIRVKLK
jgi:hypothetical protein